MTLRASKPAFNVREKLTELGRRFGLKGSELVAAETVQEARDVVSAGRKNLIINGDFRINQRYGNSSSTEKDRITVDRWFESNPGGSGMSHQTVQEAPDGFVYSEKMTMGGSVYTPGSTNTMFFSQSIEGQNVAHLNMGSSSAKSFTVSFWVRSSLTGNFSIGINNTTGGNPSNNATHAYVTHYSINVANTWEYKTVTFPGAPIGTWATNNTGGLCLIFDLGSGSGHDGTLNQWSASDNHRAPNSVRMGSVASSTWQITGVQLEVGRNATEFEHRPYGEELKLCERYFEKIWQNNNTASPHSGGDGYNTISPGVHNGSHGYYVWKFRTQKRIRPSLDYAGKFRVFGASSIQNLTFNEFYSPGVDAARLRVGHSGSAGDAFILEFDGGNSSNGYITANAEL